ncbi:ATP-binding cassette domain-containing protein [Streptomyces sp. 4503]|uniref:ATP-binding cassette domain-containing protein n=1 Tax=Streptomyces niphimycinicus TaxID=2842201 RepID=A0ABS6CM31_9ACTN|nr:ATP-binding cassette domain-containing protein [Streptomyces niphimycinicus]MBU3867980.1 ATP-binding cassette domain-containing protein [Streptomyces niphimycinicus]
MSAPQPAPGTPLLEATGITKRYGQYTALDDVDLRIETGRTVSIVGESGSGKSTLARIIVGLERADSGTVRFRGEAIRGRRSRHAFRRSVGMVFQDPYESMDPRLTIGEIVAEPLRAHGMYRDGGKERVRELLDSVGMHGAEPDAYPHKFSGGQRQRVCIARALATDPDLVICDEPTSALDVSVQAQILNLLLDLQSRRRLAYLFITHDLDVVRRISDEVDVLLRGTVVERGTAEQITRSPEHTYTRRLLGAVPAISPRQRHICPPLDTDDPAPRSPHDAKEDPA